MTAEPSRLAVLQEAVTVVGDYALKRFQTLGSVTIESKGPADYVSAVDRKAEDLARQIIGSGFPDDSIFGEEGGGDTGAEYWIVDPIDGTANFLSGIPFWAVSIAYVRDGDVILGAISLPPFDTRLTGGHDLPFTVSGSWDQRPAATPVSFCLGRNANWKPSDRQDLERTIGGQGYDIVSLGSCAASLALVALGRLEGFAEKGVKLWDCAAGHALCLASGARSSMRLNGSIRNVDIVATRTLKTSDIEL